MKLEEKNLMINIVTSYVRHIIQNKKSLIAKIFGVFSISIDQRETFYVLLLENLDPFPKKDVIFKYDRKFSKKNRFTLKKRLKVEQYRNVLMRDDGDLFELLSTSKMENSLMRKFPSIVDRDKELFSDLSK
jgi:hypothetical protein